MRKCILVRNFQVSTNCVCLFVMQSWLKNTVVCCKYKTSCLNKVAIRKPHKNAKKEKCCLIKSPIKRLSFMDIHKLLRGNKKQVLGRISL